MTRILAFGDSFVADESQDSLSFAARLAKHFDCEFENYADNGSSNHRQLDRLLYLAHTNKLTANDVILFGLTSTSRDRRGLTDTWVTATHHNMLNSWKSGLSNLVDVCIRGHHNWDLIEFNDLFFILSTLECVGTQYQIPVIKFNLYDNLFRSKIPTGISYPHNNFLGWEFKNNTLMDILDDTWATDVDRPRAFKAEIVPGPEYEKFYSDRKQTNWAKIYVRPPSSLGHEKLYQWFLNNISWNEILGK